MAIKFIRIDDRLIHGQVVVAWIKQFQGNRVLIVDDKVCKDEFLINVMKMVAPSGVELVIAGTDGIGEKLAAFEQDDKNTIILVKTPQTAKILFDAGLSIKELNVGGIGANKERKTLYRNISASDEEVAVLKELEASGIYVYIQVVPAEKQIPLKSLKL